MKGSEFGKAEIVTIKSVMIKKCYKNLKWSITGMAHISLRLGFSGKRMRRVCGKVRIQMLMGPQISLSKGKKSTHHYHKNLSSYLCVHYIDHMSNY